MPSPKISLTTLSPTINSSTAAATGTTSGNILEKTKPLRYYESTSNPVSAPTDISFNLGSQVDVGAVFIDSVNVSSAHMGIWAHATNTNPFVGSNELEVTAPVLDRKTGRYKYFWERSSTTPKQYFGLRFTSGATITEGSAVRVGSVTFIARTNYLDVPGGYQYPLNYAVTKPQVANKFIGGTIEPVSVGERYVKLKLPVVDYIRDTQQTAVLDILSNELSPIVFFENNSELEKAYTFFLESSSSSKIAYKNQEVLSVTFTFIEAI